MYPSSITKNGEKTYLYYQGNNIERIVGQNTYEIYTYDSEGKRVSKICNVYDDNGNYLTEATYEYRYLGNRLIYETISPLNMVYPYIVDGRIYYRYDSNGELIGFQFNDNNYLYVKDIMGNIKYIIDENGNEVVSYKYDDWGVLIGKSGDTTNPVYYMNSIIYKSYYYDKGIGMYWLQTRFYDPIIRRFITPDSIDYLPYESLGNLNLYSYCLNNPVNYADPSGRFAITSFLIGLGVSTLIGAVAGGVLYAASELVSYAFTGEFSWSWASFAGSVLGGTIGGALVAIPGVNAMVVAGIPGFASTAIGMGLENAWEGKDYTFGQIMFASTINGLISSTAGGLFEAVPIKGLTSGRGSYSAITKQITTKFFNGTIKRITYNTFSKMLTYNMLGSMIGAGFFGVMDATGANNWMANWFHQRTGF